MNAEQSGQNARAALRDARTVLVKVGSAALATSDLLLVSLASQLADLIETGRQPALVSSGAVALGWRSLGYRRRPKALGKVQACAAAGQCQLMQRYQEALAGRGIPVGQVLLTHRDLSKRDSLNNARNSLAALLSAGAVPIINENDTVSTEELRFGDNDQLAAMVTPLIGADVLMLLTNVAGVLDDQGQPLAELTPQASVVQRDEAADAAGTGGIQSKVSAARKAARSGAHVVIASAHEPDVVGRILAGESLGTWLRPSVDPLRARKHWIAYTLRPRGTLLVDSGAAAALERGGNSLLPIGVLGVRGQFDPGDLVRIVDAEGRELARGLSRLSSIRVARLAAGARDAPPSEDAVPQPSLVHKDDLVLTRDQ